jgi:hypothetical protein
VLFHSIAEYVERLEPLRAALEPGAEIRLG